MIPENLAQPLYIGKGIGSASYFFLANKNGVGRFLKFVKYPFWCGHKDLADEFVIGSVPPEDVVKEVTLFINGMVSFEITPKRQGRSESVSRVEVKPSTSAPPGELDVSTPPSTVSKPSRIIKKPSEYGHKLPSSKVSGTVVSGATTTSSTHLVNQTLKTKSHTTTETSTISSNLIGESTGCGVSEFGRVGSTTGTILGLPSNFIRGSIKERPGVSRDGESSSDVRCGDGESRRRRKLSPGILGVVGSTPIVIQQSTMANNGESGTSSIKAKRKRRTKAEMEAARSLLS